VVFNSKLSNYERSLNVEDQEEQLEFNFDYQGHEGHNNYMLRRLKEEEAKTEMVNHPPHYKEGEIECIDYLEDSLGKKGFSFYIEGNIKKYIHRWRHKGGIQDLKKAQWYLSRLIDTLQK